VIRSLRGLLLVETILASTAVLVVSGAVLYYLVRSALVTQLDRSLLDLAISASAGVEQAPGRMLLELEDLALREFASGKRAYMQLWKHGGAELYRSPSLEGSELHRFGGTRDAPAYRWMTLPGGRRGRAIGFTYTPLEEDDEEKELLASRTGLQRNRLANQVDIALARDTSEIDATLARVGLSLGGMGLSAMTISAAFLFWIIRKNLEPLRALASRIARLDREDLSARIEVPGAPLEIQPLAECMNEFLRRLEAAFLRETSLSSDVAHELRTPLAGMRAILDVALSRGREPAEYAEALGECHDIVLQMQSMVEKLLLLVRVEAGHALIEPRPVRLSEEILSTWKMLEAQAGARKLRVEWDLDPGVEVLVDPALLGVVLQNVLENAVSYTDDGGTMKVEITSKGHEGRLKVRNTGSSLSRDEVRHAFERFWRGDRAHSDACVHCGVGLVLVKKIVEALGGSVEARSESGGWFEIEIGLPRSVAAATRELTGAPR